MSAKCRYENQSLVKRSKHGIGGALALLLLLPVAARAGGVVTNCTEADLRTAMAGGGTVTFACDGTIALANTLTVALDTVLDASGHQISINGGNAVTVVHVNLNVAVSLINLTICNGRTPDGNNGTQVGMNGGPGGPGGGVYNAGTLTLLNCVVTANRTGHGGYASGSARDYPLGGLGGPGGGIYNTGTLTLSNSVVSGNATGKPATAAQVAA